MILGQQDMRDDLLARFFRREEGLDGRFLVGVISTGIYCLPSCPARKPKPENVVLVEDEHDALALGLRACKRCRPDLFAQGLDVDREHLRTAVTDLRKHPGQTSGVANLARTVGVGRTKLNQLTKRHYHQHAIALLLDARLDHAAKALAKPKARVLDAALAAGFEGSSAFHGNFRTRFGLTPKAFSDLGKACDSKGVALNLPERFDPTDTLNFFGRDANGVCERRDGLRAEKALLLQGKPARIELRFEPKRVIYHLRAPLRITSAMRFQAHGIIARQLGLAQDPQNFERHALRLGHGRLIKGKQGARLPLSADPFEALVWAIIGQQINLTFAATCRARLVQLVGPDAGGGLHAHPDAARIADLTPEDLLPLQFSRRKAEYLIEVSRAIATGALRLEELGREPVGFIQERLLAQRGLGPWTVRYLLMRGYGFADCVPVGDAGLSAALQHYFELNERPGPADQERLLEPFAPFRSLAVFHLWKGLSTSPRKKA